MIPIAPKQYRFNNLKILGISLKMLQQNVISMFLLVNFVDKEQKKKKKMSPGATTGATTFSSVKFVRLHFPHTKIDW